jgi:hypothetical protein
VSRYIYIGERLYEWEGVSLFQKVRLPLYFGTNVILDNTERLFVDPVSSTTTNGRIPKTQYALGLLRKSLEMLIAKGNSCNWCLGVNSLANAVICKNLLGDKIGKDLIARVVVGDACSWLLDRTQLFPRTPACKYI